MAFELDTSGAVTIPDGPFAGTWTFDRLPNLAQGYVEALFATLNENAHTLAIAYPIGRSIPCYGFSDLHPDTLAAILRDCEALATCEDGSKIDGLGSLDGQMFWLERQAGYLREDGFPTLAPYLNDEGRVRLRERV
jgi:hypothetical protein